MTDKSFYVYAHRRESDGSIFYIGKGKGPRFRLAHGRNIYWQRVTAKHGFTSEKLYDGLTSACACSIEKILIHIVGRKNLTNLTGGGEGLHELDESVRQVLSKVAKERGMSEKLRLAGLTARTGMKNSKKQKDAISKAKSIKVIASDGRIFKSVTEAARVMSDELGVFASQGNISMCARGERSNAYGRTWSYDTSEIPKYIETQYRVKTIKIVETGQQFKSTQDATRWVRSWRGVANNQCVTQAARAGSMAYGFHWTYEDTHP